MKDRRLLIIFLTVFMDLVGFGIIIPLNPYLAEAFGASPLQVGLLMSIYSLMQFIMAPVWGQWSDRIGRRPIILMSLLGAAVAHGAFAMATTMTGLLIARAFAGFFGGNISAAMAYMADITEEKKRSQSMGLIGAAFGLGFVLGPMMGGVFGHVGESLGNQPPFGPSFSAVIAAGICFLNFLFALRYLPESLTAASPKPVRGHRFARMFEALRTPVLGQLIFLVFLAGFAMAHIEASLFLLVQDRFQWTFMQASFGFGYIGLVLVFTQGYLIRKLLPKLGEPTVLMMGLMASAISFVGIGLAPNLPLMALAVTLLGLGHGMVNPALNGSVSLVSRPEVQGNNMGVSQSLSSLARILGPALGGFLYQTAGSASPFLLAGGLAFLGATAVWHLKPRLPSGAKVA